MRHSNYPPDWERRRQEVFRRDGYECQNCGYQSSADDEPDHYLHAHHRMKISDGGGHGFDNLVTVCEDCHYEIHSNSGIDNVRRELHECEHDRCDEVRGKWALHNGGYCNAQCEYWDKAGIVLEELKYEASVCSTCYSNWLPEHEVCPQCENWDPAEEDAFDNVERDVENLTAHVIWLADHLDLFRDA